VAGIRGVDRKLIELGEVNGLSRRSLFTRILLPASLPHIFTGLRTGLSLAWMFMVAAELIAATRGLGYLLSDGRETGRPDMVFGAILLLALLGKLSDSVLKAIETHVLAWRDTSQEPVGSGGGRRALVFWPMSGRRLKPKQHHRCSTCAPSASATTRGTCSTA
jgi:sulfonate transport system permease protein